jgi:putative acetyltransferase
MVSGVDVCVTVESPLQDEVRGLIGSLNEHLRPQSPPEFQFQMTVDEMAGPDTTVFVARDEAGRAVGCGALRVHPGGLGEVKRMFTIPAARGAGVGRLVLEAVIAEARLRGLERLLLESGVGPGFVGAWTLYQRAGFRPRGPFLDYPASPWSAHFELCLARPGRAVAEFGSGWSV